MRKVPVLCKGKSRQAKVLTVSWKELFEAEKACRRRPEGFHSIREIAAQTGKAVCWTRKVLKRMLKEGKVEEVSAYEDGAVRMFYRIVGGTKCEAEVSK